MDSKEITIGIGDIAVIKYPGKIVSTALGSCVAIILYDSCNKIGALAHIVLPYCPKEKNNKKPGKYANTAIEDMIKKMKRLGTKRMGRVCAKLVGGAHMFSSNPNNGDCVGARNVEYSKQALKKNRVRIKAEDTGGDYARTVILDTFNGVVIITTADGGYKEL